MNSCINCIYFELEIDEQRNTRARCKKIVPPKKGRILTWAMTTYKSISDAYLGIVAEYGDERVKSEMKHKKIPSFCPNKINF